MEQNLMQKIPSWDETLDLDRQIQSLQYEQVLNGNELTVRILTPGIPADVNFEYVFYFDQHKLEHIRTTKETCVHFTLPGGGKFCVKLYLACKGRKISRFLDAVVCDAEPQFDPFKSMDALLPKERVKKISLAEGNQSYLKSFSSEEYETLLGISDGAYFKGRSATTIERAEQLMEYQLYGFDLSLPHTWCFEGLDGRRLPYRCHSFLWIVDLLTEYWYTSGTRYRDRFLEYVFDWIRAHPEVDLTDPWAWHDDATARRALFFCDTLVLFEKILTPEQIRLLKQSIRIHATLLCKEFFYKRRHNHGMYQDRALAFYGLTCADEPEYYLLMAKARVRDYFRFSFTGDGVHKEHSPMYHMDMASSIQWFATAYQHVDPVFAEELKELLRRMSDYIAWITPPDTAIPSIGDSPLRTRTSQLWIKDPNYQWVITHGQAGTAPEGVGKVFWDAGYGVLRSSWNMDSQKDTWMMLLCATHSMAHKHNDDLSFLLYHRGPLFVEAGNRNYNYVEEKTQYVYSSYAHNVLFVNGEGWKLKPTTHLPLLEPEAFDTKIIDANTTGNIQWVTGQQTRFSGVCQKRTLRYRRAIRVVEIEDNIELEKASRLRLIYHIAPGVEVQTEKNGWLLLRDSKPVARVVADGTQNLTHITYTEDGENPWRTWVFNGKPDEEQGSLLALDMKGQQGGNTICMRVELY